jgi:hypothetical protein
MASTSPQVMPYDAGAVAASKWKIFQPFEADLHYLSVAAAPPRSAQKAYHDRRDF